MMNFKGRFFFFTFLLFLVACNQEQQPVLDDGVGEFDLVNPGSQSVYEGDEVVLDINNSTGTDKTGNGHKLTYSCHYDLVYNGVVDDTNLCTALSGLSFNTATGEFTWSTDYYHGDADPGIYEFKIKALTTLSDSTIYFGVAITNVNAPPVLDTIADFTVAENAAMTTVNAGDNSSDTDLDGDSLTYTCYVDTTVDGSVGTGTTCTVQGMTFDSTPGTGILDWTPSYTEAGSYEVKIIADDGNGATDEEIFVITVSNTDRAPSLTDIPDFALNEDQANTAVQAIDADDGGDDFDADLEAITYSCLYDQTNNGNISSGTSCDSLPGNASFDTSTGILLWTPNFVAGDSAGGIYEIEITGTANSNSGSDFIVITVADSTTAGNEPPFLDDIADQTVSEGTAISTVDAGENGADFDSESTPEALSYVCEYDTTSGGAFVVIGTCANLPGHATFDAATGILDWTPSYDIGTTTYDIQITASDAGADGTDTVLFSVTINDVAGDIPPVLEYVADETVAENTAITQIDLDDNGDDNDAETEAITYSCEFDNTVDGSVASGTNCTSLPGTVSFNTSTGVFDWTPNYDAADAGGSSLDYEILFTANDTTDSLSDTQIVVLSITDVAAPPVLDTIADETVSEGVAITTVDADDGGDDDDADDEALTYTCYYDDAAPFDFAGMSTCSGLPGIVSFDTSTGVLDFTPHYAADTPGIYHIQISATDAGADGSDSVSFIITVNSVADAPVLLDTIADEASPVTEGNSITTVDANDIAAAGLDQDADGDTIIYACYYDNTVDDTLSGATPCSSLPGVVSFNTATGVLDWRIGYSAASGANEFYEINIQATDIPSGAGGSDEQFFVVEVADFGSDSPPFLATVADTSMAEGATFYLDVNDGTDDVDSDGDSISYACTFDTVDDEDVTGGADCSTLPGKVDFDASTGILFFIPDLTAATTTYEIQILATESGSSQQEKIIFDIDVTDTTAVEPPYLDTIADETIDEGVAITQVDAGDGVDDVDTQGETISYACYYDTTVDFYVGTTNNCDSLLNLDGTNVSFNTTTGVLDWVPDFSAAGTSSTDYEFVIIGTDAPTGDTGEEYFVITVDNVGDAPPVLALTTGADETIAEGASITTVEVDDVEATYGGDSDADNDPITYTCEFDNAFDATLVSGTDCDSLPGLVNFDSDTGTLDWTLSYDAFDNGPLYEIHIEGDEGDLIDSVYVQITTTDSGASTPVQLIAIDDQTVTEGSAISQIDVNDTGGADTDVGGDTITYTCDFDNTVDSSVAGANCSTLPGDVSFDTATGVLDWTPSFSTTTSSLDFEIEIASTGDGEGDGSTIFVITVNDFTDSDYPPLLYFNSIAATQPEVVLEGVAITTINVNDVNSDADTDNDGDTISYSCYYDTSADGSVAQTNSCNALSGASFDGTTGVLDWTPDSDAGNAGYTYEFSIIGSEGDLSDEVIASVSVTNLSPQGFIDLAVGNSHACGLSSSGEAYCWGNDSITEAIGNGAGAGGDAQIPEAVTNASEGFKQITSGSNHTCALSETGAVFCWGDNSFGQIGDGDGGTALDTRSEPGASPGDIVGDNPDLNAIYIASGERHSCAILVDGSLECWGENSDDQCGDNGTSTDILSSVGVDPIDANSYFAVSAGLLHTCALQTKVTSGNGSNIYCWGDDSSEQLGDGTVGESDSSSPQVIDTSGITGAPSFFTQIASGTYHNCALGEGDVYCWGGNSDGQVGDGSTTDIELPTKVNLAAIAPAKVKKIEAGGNNTCVLTDMGSVYCWGNGAAVGDGTGVDKTTPTLIDTTSSPTNNRFQDISVGGTYACASTYDGKTYCWGDSVPDAPPAAYALSQQDSPTLITNTVAALAENTNLIGHQLSGGARHYCGIEGNGRVFCWGDGMSYQLGNGVQVTQNEPVYIDNDDEYFLQVTNGDYHSCALSVEGDAYCWGNNLYGQIGDGTSADAQTPTVVSSGSIHFVKLTAGNGHTCGMDGDGDVYCWGRNDFGQLGDASTSDKASPTLVSGTHKFIDISAGQLHTCGITEDSLAYCWGRNDRYQLGDQSSTHRSSPVAVVSGGTSFNSIYAGIYHTCAIDLAGDAYCWGDNSYGQFGDGTTTTAFIPISADMTAGGGVDKFTKLALGRYHTCALSVTGKNYCWGRNGDASGGSLDALEGALCTADDSDVNTPTEITGAPTNSVDIVATEYGACRLASNGRIYCWGDNSYNQASSTAVNALSTQTIQGNSLPTN